MDLVEFGRTTKDSDVYQLATLVNLVFQVLIYAIIIRALLSWFPISPSNPLVQLLDAITEPVIAPLRRVVPRVGMMDITPMVAIFLLYILDSILQQGLSSY